MTGILQLTDTPMEGLARMMKVHVGNMRGLSQTVCCQLPHLVMGMVVFLLVDG